MPLLFAFGEKVVDQPQYAFFAAFGAFALIGFVEFGGPFGSRVRSQLGLAVCGAVLIVVGTLVSNNAWLSAVVMALGSFVVLFSGAVSSQIARASNSLVLPLILATVLPASADQIPHRLAGFASAALVSLVTLRVLWPIPPVDPLRGPTIQVSHALAARLRRAPAPQTGGVEAGQRGWPADLSRAFLATPFRPTGLSTQTRLTVRLVEELGWLDRAIGRWQAELGETPVDDAAADVLDACADAFEHRGNNGRLTEALAALRSRRAAAETMALGAAEEREREARPVAPDDFVRRLVPSFRALELAAAVAAIGETVEVTVAADRRSWWGTLLGHQPVSSALLLTARQRALAHLSPSSVWFRNSLRGAVGLGLATFVADKVHVQHSFWVVFGTLSVLRSNAFSTGQFIWRAIAGTLAGFAVGAAVISVVGTNTGVLWAILPVSVLIGGLAPVLLSFAVGQAAFTVTILVVFTIVAPQGWEIGVVRVEDVLLGCAVSLAVALVFWPRGAGARLRGAIGEAYALAGQYLADAVDFASACCSFDAVPATPPMPQAELAIAAARRLDDAFRTYLAERGAKPVPLVEVTNLLIGSAVLRLTADAVISLWHDSQAPVSGARTEARRELVAKTTRIRSWFDELAQSLATGSAVHDPLVVDADARSGFLAALAGDLASHDGRAATEVRLVWTDMYASAAIDVQESIVDSARMFVREQRSAMSAR